MAGPQFVYVMKGLADAIGVCGNSDHHGIETGHLLG